LHLWRELIAFRDDPVAVNLHQRAGEIGGKQSSI
jgi:hypothetical protein